MEAPNAAPTAADGEVTTDEDTAYEFAAGDFNFSDSDTGDTLASVTVVTLPAAGKGVLALDGAPVTADQSVAKADLDADKLVYTPPANANGEDFASFTFRVSDGTDESALAYTMTVDVTAVNDAATGKPSISGTVQVGQTLTADLTGIGDVDGRTKADNGDSGYAYAYQWLHVDGGTETAIASATGATYTLTAADAGKSVAVRVTFTDDVGTEENVTSDATALVVFAGALVLNVDLIAGDGTVNIAEKASGFTIGGDTAAEVGVSVTVEIGSATLDATSADESGSARWSVSVPAGASYITGTSVDVSVEASKTGFRSPAPVERTLGVDLAGPTAPAYTVPSSLRVGKAIAAMSPTGGADIAGYGATGLPSGLVIDTGTGVIRGTPDTADANASEVTVTVGDAAGNAAEVALVFPAVDPRDTVPPVVSSAAVDGAELVITFDEDLAAAPNLASGAFAVKRTPRGGSEQAVALSGAPAIGGATVTLRLAQAVVSTDAVTVGYTKPDSGMDNRLEDAAGNEVADFADQPVTNNTPNAAPTVANAIPDQRAMADTLFRYPFPANTFHDADSDMLTYTATQGDGAALPAWLDFIPSDRTFTGTPAVADAGTLAVKVTAQDSHGETESEEFTLKVAETDVCARTPEVRDAIVSAVSGVTDCADVTLAHLAGITGTLDVSSSSLGSLQAGDFAGLTGLTGLFLYDNSLTELPAGVFDQLTALTSLRLHTNSLTALPAGVFDELTALADLRLHTNPGAPFSPVANAGADQSVATGASVELSGTATGAWGENVHWWWTQVDGPTSTTAVTGGVTLTGATSATASFTAPDSAGPLYFRLTVIPVPGGSGSTGTASAADWIWVEVSNTVPTAADGAVTTDEDTAYTFDAGDFGFADTDAGDALASVTVVTLPGAGEGALALDGTAVTAEQSVAKADLDADKLVYTPPANANGEDFASFTFRVSDGTDESALAYTMTVDVTAVNDAATGKPTIGGTVQVGQTLTADLTGIGDVDGRTKADNGDSGYAYAYQWLRVDGGTETAIASATGATYTLTAADAGKSVAVRVTFTDDVGTEENVTSDATAPVVFAGALVLNVDLMAGDGTVNIAEKASGFTIGGDTAAEVGVSVTVEIGSATLDATSADESGSARWSVSVPAGASYITGTSVDVEVEASKRGFTPPAPVERTLGVDLAGPTAPAYTVPSSLRVGKAIAAMSPTGGADIAGYGATGLPSGLVIDTGTGVISGTPDTADANASEVTVTVGDAAGNAAEVALVFPAVDPRDTVPPVVSSAAVDGAELVITFDEDLAAAPNLASGAFAVKRTPRGGSEQAVALSGAPVVGGATVTLRLAQAVVSTDAVTVGYTKPASGTDNRLEDAAGNEVAGFADQPVTNNTPNAAPTVANAIPDQRAMADTLFRYPFPANTFHDADSDMLTYTATQGDGAALPAWLDFIPSDRTFTGTPAVADAGTLAVKVTAQDSHGETESEEFTLKVAETDVCARTPEVRDAIVSAVSGVTDCADVTLAHLAGITGNLDVSSSGLASLQAGDFAGLTGLTGLFLYDNSLTELPAGVFDQLTALTSLRLHTNSLTALPAGLFDELTALEALTLSGNMLSALPANVFDNLTALRGLSLNGNRLTELPAGVFDELTALTALYLQGNSLTALPAEVFDELTALAALYLDDNSLAALPAEVFDELTALADLRLHTNPGAPFSPVANAGADQSVATGAPVELSGTATGAWGENVHWWWTQVDGPTSTTAVTGGVTLTGATSATASFTAPDSAGPLYFRLTVIPVPGGSGSTGTARAADWITVRVEAPNAAPTAADGEVTTDEDTAYEFAAGDFNFADADTGDALASVTVVTLPGAGEGTLALDGVAVTAGRSVAKADLGADKLVYTPPANANGEDFASFTFRVSDGTAESALAYTMTVDVTAVNDAATGQPTIGGTVQVGQTLTADLTGIADADGKTQADAGDAGYAYAYQWLHVDGGTETPIADATGATCTLTGDDAGKSVAVRVTFTDDGDHEEAVTSAPTASVPPLPVTIAANHETIGAGLENLVFTLTRTGETADKLEVTVALTQDEAWLAQADLSHEVTFRAGNATATLTIAARDFSLDPTASGELAATVSVGGMEGDSATVDVISVEGPPVRARLGERAYTFSEPEGDVSPGVGESDESDERVLRAVTVDIVLEVAPGLPRVGRELSVTLEGRAGTAVDGDDYNAVSLQPVFGGADFDETSDAGGLQATETVSVKLVDDEVYEGEERFKLHLAAAPGTASALLNVLALDGTVCTASFCSTDYPVTLTDEEDVPVLALSADPETIEEADDGDTPDVEENASELTVTLTNAKTFAGEQTLTLSFAGTAEAGTHYEVAPADADPDTGGHQVTLAAGAASVTVTVSAVDNATADGARTIEVTGAHDGTQFGSPVTVTIADDDVPNTAPTAADGEVTTDEDTAYEFAAGDFNFSDSDTGDTLASVTVVTLPAAGEGTLALDGVAVTAGRSVAKADLDADKLVYTPPANANGEDFASFTFRVSDGTAESASAYTMTVDVTAVNDPATGKPSISGTVQVGQTLTADLTGIGDVDGTTQADAGDAGYAYAYQWLHVDGGTETAIADATGATCTLTAADAGKSVAVRVTFTDDGDHEEAVTSDEEAVDTVQPQGSNSLPTAADGEVTTDEDTAYEFAAGDFNFSDSDTGDTLASVTVVTLPAAGKGVLALDGVAVTADQSVAKADLDADKLVYTPPANANGEDFASFTFRVSDGTAESALAYTMTVDVTAVDDPATGKPAISGTARVGEMLTASTSGITDADGKTQADNDEVGHAYAYQWYRVDSDGVSNETAISGATSESYTLESADAGKRVVVEVSYTDDDGNAEGPLASDAWPSIGTIVHPRGVTVSESTLAIDEGDTGTYTVVLDSQPTGPVTVTPASDDTGAATVSGALIFTELDWSTAREVTVTGVEDADAADETVTVSHTVSGADYGSVTAGSVSVTVDDDEVPNTAPTAADGEVTTDEDTAYEFAAGDFNFSDSDTGDTLASVTVVTLPAAGEGTLALDGVAVTADQSVAKADLDADKLVYTPPANANGEDFASFTFRVSDGTAESALAYTMTVDVTAVNDPATGKPSISGTATVGETLTASTSGITDVDGKTQADAGDAGYAYAYQWLHVDGGTETAIADATGATYTLTGDDAGKSVAVRVTFTDDGDHEEAVTSAPTASVPPLPVTIAANHETIGAGLENLVFTLTRTGETADKLEVTVALTQDEAWLAQADLSHEVTFRAGNATATLTIAARDFSLDPTASGELAATVSVGGMEGDSATVEVISVEGPPVRARLGERAYTFSEPEGDVSPGVGESDESDERVLRAVTVDIVLEVAPGLPRVGRELSVTLVGRAGTAVDGDDYNAVSLQPVFGGADFDETSDAGGLQATETVSVKLVDDEVYEGEERFKLHLAAAPGTASALLNVLALDGTVCTASFCSTDYPVTLTDEEDVPVLALSADPETIEEADDGDTPDVEENASELTVTLTNAKTFAGEQTLTLSFAGTAEAGTHYEVAPADADPDTGGHQVTLAAGAASVTVTVSAVDNATADGARTIEVTGTHDGTQFGSPVTVTIADDDVPNTAPTAADGEVTTDEDTAYEFAAGDFNFSDSDTGDTLASVTVVTLPAAGEGTLALDGVAVTADRSVAKADLDADKLVYTPPANANGEDFASFTFRVSDGTAESALAYTMTVDVTAVNDPATGKPSISGTVQVGETLTADLTGIADADGKTQADAGDAGYAYAYQWLHVDGGTETAIADATGATYTLTGDDAGKSVAVRVTFTDDGDHEEAVTSAPTASVPPLPVTIAANHETIGAGLENLVFTLTRTGETADKLEVTVALTQDEAWLAQADLSHEVTFRAGNATATLTIAARDFSLDPTASGELAATVSVGGMEGDSATVEVISVEGPPVRARLGERAYTFSEPEGDVSPGVGESDESDERVLRAVTVDIVLEVAPGLPRVGRELSVTLVGRAGTAVDGDDYNAVSLQPVFGGADFDETSDAGGLQATETVSVKLVDDEVYEGEERFKLHLAAAPGTASALLNVLALDGTVCTASFCSTDYPVTLTDEEDVPVLALSADPETIEEADDGDTPDVEENASELTVTLTNAKTFAGEQTLTLSFAGTAEAGTHYEVAPADADPDTGGHQVTLAAGAASVTVTVSAVDNATADGARTIEVTGTHDGTQFGSPVTVTIADDDVPNTAPTAADGEVTTDEDTAYEFAAGDFNFSDSDTGDTLASVTVVTLPGAGEGTLALDGVAVTADRSVAKADLDADKLVYTPPANANGEDFASFTFRVSDGTAESALAYTMTVDVTAVNDPATGKPSISGTVQVGQTLTVDLTGIGDVDGKTQADAGDAGYAYAYQWLHVDGGTETPIADATVATYTLTGDDAGKSVAVRVTFTDDGDHEEAVTSAPTASVPPLPVTIAANHETIGAGLENLVFTLTRTGETADKLEVTVALTQDEAWLAQADLSHEVTFRAGNATATLTIAARDFSLDPTASGELAATVSVGGMEGDSATVEVISVEGPPVRARLGERAYTFSEPEGDVSPGVGESDERVLRAVTVDIVLEVAPGLPRVGRELSVTLVGRAGTAVDGDDYNAVSLQPVFGGADFDETSDAGGLQATETVSVKLVDDEVYEGEERFKLRLAAAPGTASALLNVPALDGTVCTASFCSTDYPVTLTDEEDVPVLALSADPETIEEADDGDTPDVVENASELTVTLTNAKTFAGEQTLTLSFAGTAEAGTHYEVAPADADPDTGGHQVTLAAGAASVTVTVSAVDNATADGARTIEVTGTHDGTQLGSPVTVTIADDDVPNTAPTAADGEVTTDEDTAYEFAAGDFNFSDSDTGDTLASVTVVTLPGAGEGTLALDGVAVTADRSVAKADLDADKLVYTPPANANGEDFASFTFRVSDGTAESALAYTMTVDVTAVNDPATGKPSISGTATVGETLTASTSRASPTSTARRRPTPATRATPTPTSGSTSTAGPRPRLRTRPAPPTP